MRTIEHTVDVWDLTGMDPRLNLGMLVEHLRDFAEEGWELVSMSLNVDLADHHGPCHVLVFRRAVISQRSLEAGCDRSACRCQRRSG